MHVLVSVLNWGLGHATRSIPVINHLHARGIKITIASDGDALQLLRQEFPELDFVELPGYKVVYPATGSLTRKMVLHLPELWRTIRGEHSITQQLIRQRAITHIISDNRYGCYSAKIPSVIITHQLRLMIPKPWSLFSFWINARIRLSLQKFNQVWVPDFNAEGITKAFTSGVDIPHRYVGMLSRFTRLKPLAGNKFILGLVSGPENQRSEFERILINQFEKTNTPAILVRGLAKSVQSQFRNGVELIDHLPAKELQELIEHVDVVVTRSGYSTIMDLYQLEKRNVILVPTPGQMEQEYLADWLKRKRVAVVQAQDEFSLEKALAMLPGCTGFNMPVFEHDLLSSVLNEFLSSPHEFLD